MSKSGADKLSSILDATSQFEKWLSGQIPLVRPDLARKHAAMSEDPFSFMRATFYRWLQVWPGVCPELAKAPSILGVGDLHIENFGTWRDREGRLIWGINDLDEAWPAAYTLDLVRLVSSAYLAIGEDHLSLTRHQASAAILDGYRDCLKAGGKPFVLAENDQWLRLLALGKLRDPVAFWKKFQALPAYSGTVPREVRTMIESSFPSKSPKYKLKRRIAGLGSLGHPRILALSDWQGAFVAREAKAVRPSSWVWLKSSASQHIFAAKLLSRAITVPDPFITFHGRWMVRRLAPDCSRIELASLPKQRDEQGLLYSMGWETGNFHLGSTRAISAVKRDLSTRPSRWLHKAAKKMSEEIVADWKVWKKAWKRLTRS